MVTKPFYFFQLRSRNAVMVVVAGLFMALGLHAFASEPAIERTPDDDERLAVVIQFAQNVLAEGRDRWSGKETPLFADGLNIHTRKPVLWIYQGRQSIISNLASQQNLFRSFVGLSELTGDDRYRAAAKAAIRYHFDHLVDSSGLLHWGGHRFIDLTNLESVGDFDVGAHEFKNHFPFYELMWEVDADATSQFIRALWNAHIPNWQVLDMNRHGTYGLSVPENVWDQPYDNPQPIFESNGLSFINAGCDMIFAAGQLVALGGDKEAWVWGRRLAELYFDARHPETGLGAYQYTKLRRLEQPPETGPLKGSHTVQRFGDRAENQFAGQFGDIAEEARALWGGNVKAIYGTAALLKLGLGELMGETGQELIEKTVDGMEALIEYAYVPERNHFRPMWTDGTDLTGKTMERTGYYGASGTEWTPRRADLDFLMAYARAYRLTQRPNLWTTARQMAMGLGIGDIGESPNSGGVALSMDASGDSPQEIFALLELYRVVPDEQFIHRARVVANRMVENRYRGGFFLAKKELVNAPFDAIEPLAILTLEAALRGVPEAVPAHVGGRGYIHGRYDGFGRTYDRHAIWAQE
jgi:pectate lyase